MKFVYCVPTTCNLYVQRIPWLCATKFGLLCCKSCFMSYLNNHYICSRFGSLDRVSGHNYKLSCIKMLYLVLKAEYLSLLL